MLHPPSYNQTNHSSKTERTCSPQGHEIEERQAYRRYTLNDGFEFTLIKSYALEKGIEMVTYQHIANIEKYRPIFEKYFNHDQSDIMFSLVFKMDDFYQNKINQFIKSILEQMKEHDNKHKELKTDIKKDLLVELATKADVMQLKGDISSLEQELKGMIKASNEELKGMIKSSNEELKGMIKTDKEELKGMISSLENKNKADKEELKGMISSLENKNKADKEELKGIINRDKEELKGEIRSIRVWMKLIIGVAIVGMTFFSPMSVELIKLLK